MNEIRISGLLGPVEETSTPSKVIAVAAWLETDSRHNRVRVFAFGPRIPELRSYREGEGVQVIGRLLIDGSVITGVLIQEIRKHAIAQARPRVSSTEARELREVYAREARRGR